MTRHLVLLLLAALAATAGPAAAQFTVTTIADTGVGSLRQAVLDANAAPGAATITFNNNLGTITLGSALPVLTNPNGIAINGGTGNTVSGNNANRIFFVGVTADTPAASGSTLTVTPSTAVFSISGLTLTNGRAAGGAGAQGVSGSGGGAGLGGAIFVNAGTLSLTNVAFTGNAAVGGNGGSSVVSAGPGGGGGMGGNGGPGDTSSRGGGGGGFGPVAFGGLSSNGTAGQFTGGPGRDGAAGGAGTGTTGGASGGSGGAASTSNAPGGGGGVGGQAPSGTTGGAGGFGGGGGGGSGGGGAGGYGGGGGGGSSSGNDGAGGFGGGGGGGANSGIGSVYGGNGGNGGNGGGGGGAGLGGAVFVRQGATLNLTDGSFAGGTATGGTAGQPGAIAGQGIGSALFLAGSASYTVGAGNTVTLTNTIGGGTNAQITGGFTKAGAGTLVLAPTVSNPYTGGTAINGGTLRVVGTNFGTGFGPVAVNSTGTLGGTGAVYGGVTVNAGGAVAPGTPAGTGRLDLAGGLALTAGTYSWKLAALKDATTGTAGTDFDQVALTGGTGAFAGGMVGLDFSLLPGQGPDSANAFWSATHAWTLVNAQTNAVPTTGTPTLTNPAFADGTFAVGRNGNDLRLTFTPTPVPEPGSLALLAVAAGGAGVRWLRRRRA